MGTDSAGLWLSDKRARGLSLCALTWGVTSCVMMEPCRIPISKDTAAFSPAPHEPNKPLFFTTHPTYSNNRLWRQEVDRGAPSDTAKEAVFASPRLW